MLRVRCWEQKIIELNRGKNFNQMNNIISRKENLFILFVYNFKLKKVDRNVIYGFNYLGDFHFGIFRWPKIENQLHFFPEIGFHSILKISFFFLRKKLYFSIIGHYLTKTNRPNQTKIFQIIKDWTILTISPNFFIILVSFPYGKFFNNN